MSDGGFSVLRAELSQLTGSLLDLFRQRMEVVEEVAEHKRGTGKPVLDRRRKKNFLPVLRAMSGFFCRRCSAYPGSANTNCLWQTMTSGSYLSS